MIGSYYKEKSNKRRVIEHRQKGRGEIYNYCKASDIRSVFMITTENGKLFHNAIAMCKNKWTDDYKEALENNNVFLSRIEADQYLNGMLLLGQDEVKDSIVSLVQISDEPAPIRQSTPLNMAWMTEDLYGDLKYKGD